MTLIRSNPLFKEERAKFFYKHLNPYEKSVIEIEACFRKVDLMCNAINEKTGKNIDADEMYLMVISEMNNFNDSVAEVDLVALYEEMEHLIFKYLPVVYGADTLDVLNFLRQAENTSFSILSNTAFIKGITLRKVLHRIGLNEYFHFQIYSDETGMSKPNKQLFQLMLQTIRQHRNDPKMDIKKIIHIGDNMKADIKGADAIGINSFLVHANGKTLLDLLD